MLHANMMVLSVIELELWAIEVYIAGIGIWDVFGSCNLDLDPMTFIYELDLYCLEIYRTSYVKAYHLTDKHTDRIHQNYKACHIVVVKKLLSCPVLLST